MTTARLLPPPYSQFYDNSGNPLSGGKVYFYHAGTSTLSKVYSTYDGSSRLQNPVQLDDKGRALIYLVDDITHDMVVRSSDGSLMYEQSGIIPAKGVDFSSTHENDVGAGGTSTVPEGAIVTSITGTSPSPYNNRLYFQLENTGDYPKITLERIKLASDATLDSRYFFPNDDFLIKDNNGNTLFKVIMPSSSNIYGAQWGVAHQNGLGTAPYLHFPYITYTYGGNRKVRYLAKGTGHVYLNGYRFPNSNGTLNQKLQTDGNKVLSWA